MGKSWQLAVRNMRELTTASYHKGTVRAKTPGLPKQTGARSKREEKEEG